MAKVQNQAQFELDYKSRTIDSITPKSTKDGKITYTITLGDVKVKKSEVQEIKEQLKLLMERMDQGFKQVNARLDVVDTRLDNLEVKVDNLTVAVKELQSEAKSHGWDIKAELK